MPVPKSPSPTRTPRVALIAATAPSAAQHALQEFLQSDPGVIWLGAIAIDADTIRSLSESRPSVVVADLRVAGEIDVDAVFRALFAATPGTQIVAICAAGDEAGARRALAAGAAACLTRHSDPLAVLRAIHEAVRGRMHLSPTGQRAMRGILDPSATKSTRR
jgi:DNA-binding NarL/FixJ family response regulator